MDRPTIKVKLDLPDELADRASSTLSVVRTASELESKDPELALQIANHARAMLKAACTHYKPDTKDNPLHILCDSGNQCRLPYRGKMCFHCPVGQITTNHDGGHKFVGEQPTVEDELTAKIFNH